MKININNLDLDEFDDQFVPIEKIRKKPKDRKINRDQGQPKKESSDNDTESDNYKERES